MAPLAAAALAAFPTSSRIWLVITDPLPPGFHIGPLEIRFYGLAYAVAFLVGTTVAVRHLKRRGVPEETGFDMAFWTIVAGLIGARLYYVFQSGLLWYLTHPQHILAFWEGGMAFFGAIFAGIAMLAFQTWRRKVNFWDALDAGVLFAAVGQPIGRLGNFANGEILGPVSNLPWAVRYTNPATMAPHLGVPYQPANLYEAVGTLMILAILLLLRRQGAPSGLMGLAYLVLYPVSQLVLFNWRTDSETPVIFLGLKQAQLTSIAVLVIVVPVFVFLWLRSRPHTPADDEPERLPAEGATATD